ncbi:hypothetical protein LTR08_000435 [Meristemomyces frigidus]|nr:hypothetical protein LTR08_000435 [Meristemomyces frigidus]
MTSGWGIVELVEKVAGVRVEQAGFKEVAWQEDLGRGSIITGSIPLWEWECSIAGTPTSKAIMELAPPKRTCEEALEEFCLCSRSLLFVSEKPGDGVEDCVPRLLGALR